MNIIRSRLDRKACLADLASAKYRAKKPKGPGLRRGALGSQRDCNIRINFFADERLRNRLRNLCRALNVSQSLLVRDALDFYIGVTEQEIGPISAEPSSTLKKTK